MLVKRIQNDGKTVWSTKIGDSHKDTNEKSYSIGFSIHEVKVFLYLSTLGQKEMYPAIA